MKQNKYPPCVVLGSTVFCVIACPILVFFLLFRWSDVYAFGSALAHILRPIFMGVALAFLLLPIL